MIRPSQAPGKPGFRVSFRNPYLKRIVTAGLGTTSLREAEAYCNDLYRLCRTPADWQDVRRCLAKYERRAVEVLFGREHPELKDLPAPVNLEPQDVGTLTARVLVAFEMALTHDRDRAEAVRGLLHAYEVERFGKLTEERTQALRALKAAEVKIEELETSVARLSRAQNLHVKTRLGQAVDAYRNSDDYGRLSRKTTVGLDPAIASFVAYMPGSRDFRLAEIRAAHIESWLESLTKTPRGKAKKEDQPPEPLSPVTKNTKKRYLSAFLSFAYRRFDLAENPIQKTAPAKGAAVAREDITAMRVEDLDAFKELLDTLKKVDPYWHALVACATLAGPRYAELVYMKLDHVNLEQNYLRIATRRDGEHLAGTKTGRERSVPIESTTLRPILKAHLARRRADMAKKDATEAERSPYLFPSTVPPNDYKPRTKTPAGVWSESNTFLRTWRAVANAAEGRTGKRPYWSFGPREWRHCAGTAMGYAGLDSLRISAWLGNSEDVCRRHYVRPSTSGKLWPFKWA